MRAPSSAATAGTELAAAAMALGGLAMIGLWIPFTLAHGPTSYNEERVVGGMDMLGWGLLLGVVPNLLLVTGLLLARAQLRVGRGPTWALLGTAYAAAVVLVLVPQEVSDDFGGFRISGLVAHVAVGLGWLVLASRTRTSRLDGSI